MDFEAGLKFEEVNSYEQYFPYTFYHEESEHAPFEYSFEDVIAIMQDREDFHSTPVEDLVTQGVLEFNLPVCQLQDLRKSIKKTKNLLKRERAKNRYIYTETLTSSKDRNCVLSFESEAERDTAQLDKEIKKQKNRMSAQISRDRKKKYVWALEQENLSLQQETLALQEENRRLRKEVQGNSHCAIQQNGFIKMLIVMGMLFLISLLKDVFKRSRQSGHPTQLASQQRTQEGNEKMDSSTIFMEQELDYKSHLLRLDSADPFNLLKERVIDAMQKTKKQYWPSDTYSEAILQQLRAVNRIITD